MVHSQNQETSPHVNYATMKVRHESLKRRKIQTLRLPSPISTRSPSLIVVLDVETHRGSNVQLWDICVEATPITFFEQGIFGKIEVLLDLYQHFVNEVDKIHIQEAIKDEGLTHEKMDSTRMLEEKVKYFISTYCA